MSILRTEGIIKDYPGTRALDDVTVSFDSGKVHAFIGKNGSGKSTLVKVFAGAIQPTSGHFYLDEEELHFSTPVEALNKGIATVYQELSLVPHLSVAENIFLGRLPKKGRLVDWKRTYQMAGELLHAMGVDIDPHEKVFRLSMWQCQVVEITKAMSFKPKVLMLDEPTSALDPISTSKIEDLAMELKEKYTIIIVTHNMQQAARISDQTAFFLLGECVEFGDTGEMFAMPKDKRTEDYITGRFG